MEISVYKNGKERNSCGEPFFGIIVENGPKFIVYSLLRLPSRYYLSRTTWLSGDFAPSTWLDLYVSLGLTREDIIRMIDDHRK